MIIHDSDHTIARDAETTPHENAEQLDRFFTLSLDMLCIAGFDGYFKRLNPSFARALGFTTDALLAEPFLSFVHPDDQAAIAAKIATLAAGMDTSSFESRFRRQDGGYTWMHWNAAAFPDQGLIYATARDITERKQAEDALRMAEARYRTLVEQIPAIIYTADINATSTTRYVSPQIEAILGFSPAEWMADPELWLKQIYPDDRERVLACVEQAQASDQPIPAEYRSFTRDGRLVWLQDAGRVVRDETGQPLLLQGITLDITARKQAEEALRESERLYRTLASNFPNGAVVLFDHDLRFTLADGTGLSAVGLTREQLEGRTIWEVLPPEACAIAEPSYRAALAGTPNVREATFGDRAYIIHTLPLRDERGEIIAGMVMSQDITERKRMENAQQEREAHFRALIEHSSDAIALIAIDGTLLYGSPATVRVLGYTMQEFIGRNAFDLIHPDEHPEIARQLASVVSQPEASISLETRVQHADGSWRDLEGTLTNLLGDPAVGAVVINYRDITERKQAQEALAKERALLARHVEERTADLSAANAELARAGRLKDEFLASMSHELRTPLNAILGLSEALQEGVYGPLVERQHVSLHSIEESGRHLLALINDILDLAKIGAGKIELEYESVSIRTVCQASLQLVRQAAQKKQLVVELTIDPAVTLMYGDARRLKQILVNLLANAVKFTPPGGAIGLKVVGDLNRQVVDLTVWDTGIGIAPEDLSRLFQPFVQLDSRLARQYEGTGLGLVLVSRMAELHGGSVRVASEPGVGSRFTVSLPWQVPSGHGDVRKMQQEPPAANERPAALTPPAILLAEDNELNILTITGYLEAKGYRILVARNGAEAVARARESRPALILMDIQMPDMDGLEAIRRIRAQNKAPSLPIIALTALAMPGDRERCLAAGADEYLSKPVSLKGLVAAVDTQLRKAAHPHQEGDCV
jgi:PAS domain S-box-containing protein